MLPGDVKPIPAAGNPGAVLLTGSARARYLPGMVLLPTLPAGFHRALFANDSPAPAGGERMMFQKRRWQR